MKYIYSKLTVVILACFALVGGLTVGHALYPDPEFDAGVIRILSSGLVSWKILTTSGNLDIYENTNINAQVFRINATDGSVMLRQRTATQLAALAPSAAGEMIFNSTKNMIAFSTGTGPGAWVFPSTSAFNAASAPNCATSNCVN